MAMHGNTIGEKTVTELDQEVFEALSQPSKSIPSKYLYDDLGSQIFQEIMEMPEYYPTNCELEILRHQSVDIVAATGFGEGFNIVELGAGDGLKIREILRLLTAQGRNFSYFPIDISGKAMQLLEDSLVHEFPELDIRPLVGDYFEVLSEADFGGRSTLFLLLGGNIGNYDKQAATDLLQHFGDHLRHGDCMLVGVDLKKNPHVIQQAYDDPRGITERFNLNLLTRMNREMGANFDLSQFCFYCAYHPTSGDVRSYLFSRRNQVVRFEKMNQNLYFRKNELIFTERSKKYSPREIETLAKQSGFQFQQHFFDSKKYFTDSLWKK